MIFLGPAVIKQYITTVYERRILTVIIVKNEQFTTPFKDDIRQLADIKSKYHKR